MSIILFADDDTDLLGINTFMLRNLGFEVITAINGEEAVTKFKENNPDITIMDIRMPKMDGFDAFFKIKKIDLNAKVVLISAYNIDEKKLLQAKSMGLLGLITKPYEFNEIVDLITSSLTS